MGFDHRKVLGLSTDIAIGLFVLFAGGAVAWVADEFLRWNLLPDWIDRYAQGIVVIFGVAGGLAVGVSLLCSAVVIAESMAHGVPAERKPGQAWSGRVVMGGALAAVLVLAVMGKVDALRKESLAERRRAEGEAQFAEQVKDLRAAAVDLANAMLPPLLRQVGRGVPSEAEVDLLRFLNAAQASTRHRPAVSLLVKASPPYRYCHLRLAPRHGRDDESVEGRFVVSRQFYLNFPKEAEAAVIEALFQGRVEPLAGPLDGEVLKTGAPGSWQVLQVAGEIVGVLVVATEYRPPSDMHHNGPGGPPSGKGM